MSTTTAATTTINDSTPICYSLRRDLLTLLYQFIDARNDLLTLSQTCKRMDAEVMKRIGTKNWPIHLQYVRFTSAAHLAEIANTVSSPLHTFSSIDLSGIPQEDLLLITAKQLLLFTRISSLHVNLCDMSLLDDSYYLTLRTILFKYYRQIHHLTCDISNKSKDPFRILQYLHQLTNLHLRLNDIHGTNYEDVMNVHSLGYCDLEQVTISLDWIDINNKTTKQLRRLFNTVYDELGRKRPALIITHRGGGDEQGYQEEEEQEEEQEEQQGEQQEKHKEQQNELEEDFSWLLNDDDSSRLHMLNDKPLLPPPADDEFPSLPFDDDLIGDASTVPHAHNAGFVPVRPSRLPQTVSSSADRTRTLHDDAYYLARHAARDVPKKKRWWHSQTGEKMYRLKKQGKSAVFLEWMIATFDMKKESRGYACIKGCTNERSEVDGTIAAAAASSTSSYHVMDVAGGRGQLAFFLAAFYSIRVFVIDPVIMNLKREEVKYQNKRMRKRKQEEKEKKEEKEQEVQQANDGKDTVHNDASNVCDMCSRPIVPSSTAVTSPSTDGSSSTNAAISPPASSSSPAASSITSDSTQPLPWLSQLRHFQCLFPSSIGVSLHKNHARQKKQKSMKEEKKEEEEDVDENSEEEEHIEQDCECDTVATAESVTASFPASSSSLHSILSTSSLIYGMHSDGATEALVDYALLHKKDFAVVPCCVFPNAAPNRRVRKGEVRKLGKLTQQGKSRMTAADVTSSTSAASFTPQVDDDQLIPVRSYEDFIAYLLAKDPTIQRADLDFEGRNIVLYRKIQK